MADYLNQLILISFSTASFAIFLFLFGPSFFQKLLHHGFFAGLELEDAAKAADVFAGDGLEDDAVALLHEVDARARLDAEPPPDARRNDQLALGSNVGGVHGAFFRSDKVWSIHKCKASTLL